MCAEIRYHCFVITIQDDTKRTIKLLIKTASFIESICRVRIQLYIVFWTAWWNDCASMDVILLSRPIQQFNPQQKRSLSLQSLVLSSLSFLWMHVAFSHCLFVSDLFHPVHSLCCLFVRPILCPLKFFYIFFRRYLRCSIVRPFFFLPSNVFKVQMDSIISLLIILLPFVLSIQLFYFIFVRSVCRFLFVACCMMFEKRFARILRIQIFHVLYRSLFFSIIICKLSIFALN